MSKKSLNAVEIFAGGGGLSVGLKNAGVRVVAAIEREPHAAETYVANHPDVQVIRKDIVKVRKPEIEGFANGGIDILAACPPCQGFSSLTAKSGDQDSRNRLVLQVERFARILRPEAIMMENVPGLAGKGGKLLKRLLGGLKKLGYCPNYGVLEVADYGVPQRRKRLVMVAGRGFEVPLPTATHSRGGKDGLLPWRTVRSAIGDFDEPMGLREAQEAGGPEAAGWHVVRNIKDATRIRFEHIQSGGSWKDIPENLRPPCHRGDFVGFNASYGRLSWDEPSGTITSGCTTLSMGRFGHPESLRTISVREAACLQTFPEGYKFVTPSIGKACEIIGNALPCKFAEAVAGAVRQAIEENGRGVS